MSHLARTIAEAPVKLETVHSRAPAGKAGSAFFALQSVFHVQCAILCWRIQQETFLWSLPVGQILAAKAQLLVQVVQNVDIAETKPYLQYSNGGAVMYLVQVNTEPSIHTAFYSSTCYVNADLTTSV